MSVHVVVQWAWNPQTSGELHLLPRQISRGRRVPVVPDHCRQEQEICQTRSQGNLDSLCETLPFSYDQLREDYSDRLLGITRFPNAKCRSQRFTGNNFVLMCYHIFKTNFKKYVKSRQDELIFLTSLVRLWWMNWNSALTIVTQKEWRTRRTTNELLKP